MKKKIILISSILICIIILIVEINIFKRATAKIDVKVKDTLEVEVYENVRISDFIKSINGKIIDDKIIDTSKVGEKEIIFDYINDDNIKVNYSFRINVKDTEPPLISSKNKVTIYKDYNGKLENEFFCGDNYDDTPICTIRGEYNLNEVGEYNLEYIAIDSSKNQSTQKFTLTVKEKENNSNSNEEYEIKTIDYNNIIKDYKNKNTKIGIDISKWQGDIDFNKVKESGVEFAMIRVGSEDKDGNLFIDPKFEKNIKGFNKVKIAVGIYYYSYADSTDKAREEAKWVVKQLKKYKIDLPVVFDWENWSNFREYNLSFHSLTEVAETFLNEVEKSGYKGMLYSSKYYLENIWYPTKYKVWLAHYTEQTNYEGKYYMWQLCSNGKVNGIDDNLVDIDILYK